MKQLDLTTAGLSDVTDSYHTLITTLTRCYVFQNVARQRSEYDDFEKQAKEWFLQSSDVNNALASANSDASSKANTLTEHQAGLERTVRTLSAELVGKCVLNSDVAHIFCRSMHPSAGPKKNYGMRWERFKRH